MKIKKIIISTVLIVGMTSSVVLAYSNNVKLNTEEYVSMLNTNIAEMSAEVEVKEKGTIGSTLWSGIEEGYIQPSINNDTKLMNGVSDLVSTLKQTKIIDNSLENKHNQLMNKMEELVALLNGSIELKKEILNSNEDSLKKGKRVLTEDEEKMKLVNNKIEEINQLYQEINNFTK